MKNKIQILDLRPTQYVLGMKEVEAKNTHLAAMSEKDLKKFCDSHVIPVVIGPGSEYFMIDHHHFARTCWELDIQMYSLKVLKDLRRATKKEFWNFMVKQDWTYLYDQFGMGPHSPDSLPSDIRGMADDPYRSLAWAVRDAGDINKVSIPFFEFRWAAFFRRNLGITLHSKSDFKEAIQLAKKMARSKDASHLPGYKKISS
ncbi:MAG: ParB-like protein [Bacteriovorax sp.]